MSNFDILRRHSPIEEYSFYLKEMFLLITPIFESITFDIFSLDGEVVSKEISIPVGKDFDMF